MTTRGLVVIGGVLVVAALVLGSLSTALAQTPWGAAGRGAGGMMGGMMGGPGGGMMAGDAARWFIEDMIPHHQDAVAMADLALTRAEHQETKDLAAAIKTTQTTEIEQMRAWYRQWYGAEPGPSQMPGQMPRMGSPAALQTAQPFDQAFIAQMVPHHQMAVMMTTMALPRVEQPELRGLLQAIITSQSAELGQMSQWYRAWYGTTVPALGPGMMDGGMMGGGRR